MLNYSIKLYPPSTNQIKMISKWAFISSKSCHVKPSANIRRWTHPVITLPNDQDAYNRFVRQDRTRAHLMLLTHADDNLINDVALSALNKFTSLRPAHPFAPPVNEISILRGMQVPQTAADRDNQSSFLNNFRQNMEISSANIGDNIAGQGMYVNTGLPDAVVRAVSHVTSALIPNIVCVIDYRVNYSCMNDAVHTQLDMLELGHTAKVANEKGIIVCAYELQK